MADYRGQHTTFTDLIPVAPSDTSLISSLASIEDQQGLYIATGGTITLQMASGRQVGPLTVPDNTNFYGKVAKVMLTGTTASNIFLMV